MAKSGLRLVARASWEAGRSWRVVTGAAEEAASEVWTIVGLVGADGVGAVSAGACGGLRAASREAVAS
jgi:hypothetical protein